MAVAKGNARIWATVDEKTKALVEYWADQKGITGNAFVRDAIYLAIDFENNNFPMTTITESRIAELIDAVNGLSANQATLEETIKNFINMMIQMTKGDNYLMDNYDSDSDIFPHKKFKLDKGE